MVNNLVAHGNNKGTGCSKDGVPDVHLGSNFLLECACSIDGCNVNRVVSLQNQKG